MSDIKFCKLDSCAIIPTRASAHAAGLDLYAIRNTMLPSNLLVAVDVGLCAEIPAGYYARIVERSGLCLRHSLCVKAGTIDADYRGPISVLMYNFGDED